MSIRVITAEEVDLLTFFEVEPTLLDPDNPWPYNDFVYRVTRPGFEVSFAVAPAYRDVRLILTRDGVVLYELNAMGVDDVRYLKDANGETLEIVLTSRDSLYLRLAPELSIVQRVTDGLTDGA
jgi:hypothetical protein